jgi:hypothetical protein
MSTRLFAASVLIPAVLGAAEHRAQDGSFTVQLPAGWNAREISLQGTPLHVIEPAAGGDERILLSVGPTQARNVNELCQLAAMITVQLFPGLRLEGMPRISGNSAELRYSGNGASAWQSVTMANQNQAVAVTALARPERLAAVEQASRNILGTVRMMTPTSDPSSPLARIIVGRWTYFHRTHNTGSSSRQITFFLNGRYDYQATVMMNVEIPTGVDPTTRITGTYTVRGNTVSFRADNGQTAQYTVQIVEGGKGLQVNGDLYIRE